MQTRFFIVDKTDVNIINNFGFFVGGIEQQRPNFLNNNIIIQLRPGDSQTYSFLNAYEEKTPEEIRTICETVPGWCREPNEV